jgi:hypothetical protein
LCGVNFKTTTEQFLQMGGSAGAAMELCAEFPLKLAENADFASARQRNKVQFYQNVYYRFMPYAPATEFSINSLLQMLMPHCVAPSRLLRLSGKSSENYGQCTYYQGEYSGVIYVFCVLFCASIFCGEVIHF